MQIGHVRRLVVSHGVLLMLDLFSLLISEDRNLHAFRVKLVTARETHDLADAVDILL